MRRFFKALGASVDTRRLSDIIVNILSMGLSNLGPRDIPMDTVW